MTATTTALRLRARPRDLMLVDLDCFYVSVERVRDPALCGRPVIVGGLPHERGVVASASYEARAYGVRAGMPLFQAARRCPPGETVFLHGDHQAYMQASRDVFEVLERFTPRVEPLSLDEALLDLAGCERHHASWLAAAAAVHAAVREATGLDVSIGIGGTRAVARIALALAKPGGVLEVRRGEEATFLGDLPLRFLPGVGGRTHKALERFNLRTIGDLGAVPEEVLEATFGRTGVTLSRRARGLDAELDAHVVGERAAKRPTISRETSLAADTNDPCVVDGMLSYLAQRACATARERGLVAHAVSVRLRYADFKSSAMRRRLPLTGQRDEDVLATVRTLWPLCWQRRVKIRLVGVTLHGLERRGLKQQGLERRGEQQLELLEAVDVEKHLDAAVDQIRERHGFGSVVRGRAIGLLKTVPTSTQISQQKVSQQKASQQKGSRLKGFHLSTPACSK